MQRVFFLACITFRNIEMNFAMATVALSLLSTGKAMSDKNLERRTKTICIQTRNIKTVFSPS